MVSENDDLIFRLEGKCLLGLIIIIGLVIFTLTSYVNAMMTFQPSTVSQYAPAPPPRRNRSPLADAGPDQWAFILEAVFFNGSGSNDPDGVIKIFNWSFNDGASASGVNVSHLYSSEGIYTVTLTVTDDDGSTDADTCEVTVLPLTNEEIGSLPINEAVQHLMNISPDAVFSLLMNMNVSAVEDIFEMMDTVVSADILEAAVYMDKTDEISEILLEMEEDISASLLVEVETGIGADIVETMIGSDLTDCARVVEAAFELDAMSTSDILEEVETELLIDLLIEISILPSTPSTVAAIFEVMSIDKVLEIVGAWMSRNALPELGRVFGYMTEETLNNVYSGLTEDERVTLYQYLSTETIASIQAELLPLPDLTPTIINVYKTDGLGYMVSSTIENQGKSDSGKATVELSADAKIIDKVEIEGLSKEASTIVTYNWTPASARAYTLIITVDPESIIDELNETNNEIKIAYGVELPDITVSMTTLPTELIEKKTYRIEIEVSNKGEFETGAFDVMLKASGVTAEARWISTTVGLSNVENIEPGSTRSLQFSWRPEEAGAFTLEAIVDPQEKVLEGDETNNIDGTNINVEAQRNPWPIIAVAIIVIMAIIIFFVFREKIIRRFSPFVYSFMREKNLPARDR